jgi:hypothetical protein
VLARPLARTSSGGKVECCLLSARAACEPQPVPERTLIPSPVCGKLNTTRSKRSSWSRQLPPCLYFLASFKLASNAPASTPNNTFAPAVSTCGSSRAAALVSRPTTVASPHATHVAGPFAAFSEAEAAAKLYYSDTRGGEEGRHWQRRCV